MIPILTGISGAATGLEISLERETFTIGRHSENDVCIPDPSASRQHCRISLRDSEWVIRDLDSANGTSVNGQPIDAERILSNGDRIGIGDSVFCFCTADPPDDLHSAAGIGNADDWAGRPTHIMSREQVQQTRSGTLIQDWPAGDRATRGVKALLSIGNLLSSIHNVRAINEQLGAIIADAIPAEAGAIVMVGYGDCEQELAYQWSRQGWREVPVRVSRTILDRVIGEGVAVLATGPGPEIASAQSLIMRHVTSVICVPMLVRDQVHGAIYLETTDPVSRFDAWHLQVLSAIAGYAGLALDSARRVELLEKANAHLRTQVHLRHAMVGDSAVMRDIYDSIRKLAQTDATVLITGESGTGKELAARALHLSSARSSAPFEAINCALLRDALLESELFGHEKGAFTGAITQKRGRLELANGGTVFLDELSELPAAPQAMLLRFLQEREFLRVGGTRPIRVDVRVVAATNTDLEQAVNDRAFRKDLFYRLNVIRLRLPPLRERREDIPLLAQHFLQRAAQRSKKLISGISVPALASLTNHSWPGNIRELENAIEYAVAFTTTGEILIEDLPEVLHSRASHPFSISSYHDSVRKAREDIVMNALKQANYNYSMAAKALGIHVNNLHRLIRELNLRSRIPQVTSE